MSRDSWAFLSELARSGPWDSLRRRVLARLAEECGPALHQLRRRGRLGGSLQPEDELEIVHEAVAELLEAPHARDAENGGGLRLLGRAAYRLARLRGATRSLPLDTLGHPPPIPVRAPPWPNTRWSRLVGEPELHKESGGLHVRRLSTRTGIPERELRRQLRAWAAELGRDATFTELWLRRLGDATVRAYEQIVERETRSLVPALQFESDPLAPPRRVLERLSRCPVPARFRKPVRLLRRLVRQRSVGARHCPAERALLREAALCLHRDPFRVRLAHSHELLETGAARAALAELDSIPEASRRRPGRGGRRPRIVRYALARARCLAALAREHEAFATLRALPPRSRDGLVWLDLLLLAERVGAEEEAARCRSQLQRLARSRPESSPLLRLRIRKALEPVPCVESARERS